MGWFGWWGCRHPSFHQSKPAAPRSHPPPSTHTRDLLRASGLKVSSQWRKTAPRLEGDPAFGALEKVDRLRLFQVGGWGDVVCVSVRREEEGTVLHLVTASLCSSIFCWQLWA